MEKWDELKEFIISEQKKGSLNESLMYQKILNRMYTLEEEKQ